MRNKGVIGIIDRVIQYTRIILFRVLGQVAVLGRKEFPVPQINIKEWFRGYQWGDDYRHICRGL